jgi:hypothetical protein
MYSNEIISEVWRNRDAYVEEQQYDRTRIITDLKRRQEKQRHCMIDRRISIKKHSAYGNCGCFVV